MLYNSADESIYDETILSNLPLRATVQGLDHTPSKLEMLEAIGKLHDSALSPRRFRVESFGMEGISRVEVVTMVTLLPGGGSN